MAASDSKAAIVRFPRVRCHPPGGDIVSRLIKGPFAAGGATPRVLPLHNRGHRSFGGIDRSVINTIMLDGCRALGESARLSHTLCAITQAIQAAWTSCAGHS